MSYPDRPITIKVDGLNQVHNHFVSISEGTHDKLSVRSLVLSSLGILSDENLTVSHSVGGWKDWIKLEGPGTVTVTNESEFDVVMSKPLRPVFVNPENKRYFVPVPSGKRSVSTLARTILSALRQHKVFADKEMASSRVFHRASAGASWKELSRYESKKVVVDVVPSSSFMVERVKDVSHALKPVYAGQQKVWVPVETGNVSNETVITAIKNKLGITAADTKCQVYHFPTRWSRGTLMEDGRTITVTHESLFSVLYGGAGGPVHGGAGGPATAGGARRRSRKSRSHKSRRRHHSRSKSGATKRR